jgi:hypothetical protein
MNRHVKNVGFVIAVLVAFVALAEVVARLAAGSPVPERTQPIARHEEGEIEYGLIPNIDREYAGARVVTNSLGLRDFRPPSRDGGEVQILVLGDSFTFGYGVPLEESYPNLLEQHLNATDPDRYEVVNAGVPGYDTVDEAGLLEKILPFYSPRWIIVGLHPGDLLSRQDLKQNLPVRAREWLRKHSALFSWMLRTYKTKLIKYVPPPKGALTVNPEGVFTGPKGDRIRSAFEEIRGEAAGRGAEVVVFMVVPLIQWERYPYRALHESVARFCNDHGMYFVDPLAEFSSHDAGSMWVSPNDSHYNGTANDIAAGVLAGFILDHAGETGGH